MWQNGGSLIVSDAWSFSAPITGELIRLSHFCPEGYGRGLLCQASFSPLPDLFSIQRLYYREERELIVFERPAPFDRRVLGVRSFQPLTVGEWVIFIEFWNEKMPLFPDSNNPQSSTGTTTSVTASTTSVVLLAANSSRKGVTIYNNSTVGTLYISFGATASTTAFAEKISSNTLWEMPISYNGVISGVWSTAGGNAAVTEFS